MKLSIVYDSKTGNTAKMAEYIIEGVHRLLELRPKHFLLSPLTKHM